MVPQMAQQVKNLFAVQETQKKKKLIILRWKKVDLKNKPS